MINMDQKHMDTDAQVSPRDSSLKCDCGISVLWFKWIFEHRRAVKSTKIKKVLSP
jgi:hypothetical protein